MGEGIIPSGTVDGSVVINSPAGARLDRRLFLAGVLAATALGAGRASAAPDFPSRPLTIMVPANPGGGWISFARLMQRVISEDRLSPKPIEILNKGGAGGAVGLAELVSRRFDDPYTIMAAGLVMIGSTIAQSSPFRVTDTAPLARLVLEHLIVAVPAASPYRTIEDLVAAFRRDPGSISWCGGSAGGVDHILVGLIAEAAGTPADKVRYVAYSGGGEASAAIMGGQVTAAVAGYGEYRGLAEDGRIRILAAASPQRIGDGTVPTLREAGLDVVLQNWRGVFAPPRMKPEHLAWWTALLERLRRSAHWQQYLLRNGWEDGFLAAADFGRFIASEEKLTTRTLARLGIGGTGGGYAPMGPWAFPTIVGVAGAAAVGAVAVEQIRARPGEAIVPAGLEDDDEGGGPLPVWRRFFAGAGLVALYLIALWLIGFLIATPVFILALCALMGSRSLVRDGIAGAVLTVSVWLLFTRLLYVHLP